MTKEELVEENYRKFCELEGNSWIASEYALLQIVRIIEKFEIKSVLEIGLGIGSISDTVLKYQKGKNDTIRYVGTEANPYCLDVLKSNVQDFPEIELYNSLDEIPPGKQFELVIIDGQDETLPQIADLCTKRAIIFIEGDRSPQMRLIFSLFPKSRYVHVISTKKNKIYSPGSPDFFVGGGRIFFTNPSLRMYIFWLQNKLSTIVKRYLRKFQNT